MRTTRIVLGVIGFLALSWGAWLVYPMINDIWMWFISPPILDDAAVLPIAGLISLGIVRWTNPAWRWPLYFGLAATVLLVFLGFTEIWRPYGLPPKPGLHDRDYVSDVLITLATLWAVVMIAGLLRSFLRKTATRRN